MGQEPAPIKERASLPTFRSCFAHEWISVGHHRILIHQRNGAPGTIVRRAAMAAAWMLEASLDTESRVVECWFDNRYESLSVTIGTPASRDAERFSPASLKTLYEIMLSIEPTQIEIRIVYVPDGWACSDAYDHTAHVVRAVMNLEGKERYLD